MTRILLVDDEASYMRLFKYLLEDSGEYEVRTVNDSERALEAAHDFQPDLAILDVIMPRMSGLQVAAAFREDPDLSSLPIIFMTATASRRHPAESHELLRDCIVLSKPISTDEVVTSIRQVLGKEE